MSKRIVDISRNGRHLSVSYGFLVVTSNEVEVGRVAIDDILSLIISGRGATHSSALFARFAAKNIPVVVCDANYHPVAWVLGVDGNTLQSARMIAQIMATQPMKKSAWKDIVVSKVLNQAEVLDLCNGEGDVLRALSKKVRSGDVGNIESQAALYYWKRLFGNTFRRVRAAKGVNSMLNYGYTIIRSCVARAVMSTGLHPTLGIHHRGPSNSFCLVDDLMEPYRPIVDYTIWKLSSDGINELTDDVKLRLAELTVSDTEDDAGTSTVYTSIVNLSMSLSNVFEGKGTKLVLPEFYEPLTMLSATSRNLQC